MLTWATQRVDGHLLRDTFAVNLLIAGVPMDDVQLYLGHSSIKTTEQHYAPLVRARPSELFGLTWGCYTGNVFTIVNTAWRGRLQRKKIKRKNRYGRINYRLVAIPQAVRKAIDLWRARCPNPDANALMFPVMQARARKALATPIHPDNWLRLYPVANKLGIAFHPTFQVLRRSFSTQGNKEAHPTEMQAQLGHSDIRATLDIYTQITDPEVARMVNQVTNRILGLGEEVEPGSVQ